MCSSSSSTFSKDSEQYEQVFGWIGFGEEEDDEEEKDEEENKEEENEEKEGRVDEVPNGWFFAASNLLFTHWMYCE